MEGVIIGLNDAFYNIYFKINLILIVVSMCWHQREYACDRSIFDDMLH